MLELYDFKSRKAVAGQTQLVRSIVVSPKGDILLATKEGIKKVDVAFLNQNKIRFSVLPPVYSTTENVLADYLYFDHQKNFWLNSPTGFIKIDPYGLSKTFSVKNGLPVNNYISVFEDKENILWFADGQAGISKMVNTQFELNTELKPHTICVARPIRNIDRYNHNRFVRCPVANGIRNRRKAGGVSWERALGIIPIVNEPPSVISPTRNLRLDW